MMLSNKCNVDQGGINCCQRERDRVSQTESECAKMCESEPERESQSESKRAKVIQRELE